MQLKVNSCGTHGMATWLSEPHFELVNIMADGITSELARNVAARLREGTDRLVISDPVLSDEDRVVTVEMQSEVSSVHLREQTGTIRQIIGDELTQAGVTIMHPERS